MGVVVADKAVDANSLLAVIEAMTAMAVIPPKANRIELRCDDKTHCCRAKYFRIKTVSYS